MFGAKKSAPYITVIISEVAKVFDLPSQLFSHRP
jgi:hypothetical protein